MSDRCLDRKNLQLTFLFTLFLTLTAPVLLPGLHLLFFVPFLIILFYQKPLPTALWASLFCGLILDLLSSHHRLGLNALSYCITTGVLYRQRSHFFADRISTLSVMTFFFSVLSTIFQVVLISALDKGIPLSQKWFIVDLLVMPVCDAFYAFVVFILPALLFGKHHRQGKDYFQN